MAVVTTDTTLSALSYSSGETIDVGSGAVLTIDTDTTVPPGNVRVIDDSANVPGLNGQGTVRIENTSSTVPIVFTFWSAARDFRIENAGQFIVRGDWITLFTSTGIAGQTVDMSNVGGKSIDFPSLIEVETASGSGEFVPWPVVCIATPTGTARAVSDFGSQECGRVCFYDEAAQMLSFGDGTNGTIPPTGATVRMPNIHITSAAGHNSDSSRSQLDLNPGGSADVEICQFSHNFYLRPNSSGSLRFVHVGVIGAFGLTNSLNPAEFSDIAVGYDPRDMSPTGTILSNSFGSVSVARLHAVTLERSAINLSTLPLLTSAEDLTGIVLDRTSSNHAGVQLANLPASASLARLTAIGGLFRMINMVGSFVRDVAHSDQTDGVNTTSTPTSAVRTTNASGVVVTGIRNALGGAACRNYVVEPDIQSVDCTFDNIDYDCQGHARFLCASVSSGLTISNANLQNVSSSSTAFVQGGAGTGMILKNVIATFGDSEAGRILASSGARYEFVSSTTGPRSDVFPAYVDGGQFQVLVDDPASTGVLQIGPFGPQVQQSSFDVIAGSPAVTNGGAIQVSASDQIVFRSQESCRSITGFQAVAPVLNFTGSGVLEFEAVDSGGAFAGAWLPLDAANLSAVAVGDSDAGIDLRIRLTVSTAGNFRSIRLATNNDSGYQSTDARVTLLGPASDDIVRLRLSSDDTEIATFTGPGEQPFFVGANLFADAYAVRENAAGVELMRTQSSPFRLVFGDSGTLALFAGAEVQLAQAPLIDAAISSRPDSATIAADVRAELATELARVDVAISTRTPAGPSIAAGD